MTGALGEPAGACGEREDVSGPQEVGRSRVGVCQAAHGRGAFGGRHLGDGQAHAVHRDLPLRDDQREEPLGRLDPQAPRGALVVDPYDLADGVHVALDQVAGERVAQRRRGLR
nr:hypothetical protein [Nonomuraea aridisoli]